MEATQMLHHLPSFLFVLLLTIYLFPLSSSTNTTATTSANGGIIVNLIHVDAHMNLTYQEHIHAGISRTNHRAMHHTRRGKHHHHHHHHKSSPPRKQETNTLEMTLEGQHGEYVMTLAIGTPPTSFSATMDTGSPLVWAECYHPMDGDDPPVFDPESSSSYSTVPCTEPICNNSGIASGCNGVDCGYTVKYADQSGSKGILSWETFTLGSSLIIKNISFGCSDEVNGFDYNARAMIGMNRARLSLISQLGSLVGYQFSYCLSGYNAFNQSKLILGTISHPIVANATTIISAPLLVNPANPQAYFVALRGISVGGTRLPIPDSAFRIHSDGSGGVVLDSGSTFTGLVKEAFDLVKAAFLEKTDQQWFEYSPNLRLETCLDGLPGTISIPTFTLQFEGGNLQLPLENYILVDSASQMSCLAILQTPATVNIIGATTLQNIHANFDLGKNIINFTPVQCSGL